VRDGIELARRGVPAVACVTEAFWPQGDFVARSAGMPDVPRLRLPHPCAGTGADNLLAVARDLLPEALRLLGEGR
jgi:hypothetical protein